MRELPAPVLRLTVEAACPGSPTQFRATPPGDAAPADLRWRFGDPGSGAADSATGIAPTHWYAQPGTYTVRVQARLGDGSTLSTTRQVIVAALPTVALTPVPALLCAGSGVVLVPSPQPAGTRYHWSDGSAGPTLAVQAPGRYYVDVTAASGCTSRAEARVEQGPCLMPNIITPNGDAANQALVFQALTVRDRSIRIYNRWGREVYRQERYDNAWAAPGQPDGLYYYLLIHASSGQHYRGWVEVSR